MLETNNIPNLFEQIFSWLFYRMIARKILDIILYGVNIRINSQIYPLQGGYPESFRLINS